MITNNPNVTSWSLQNGYSNPYNIVNYLFQKISTGRHSYLGLLFDTYKNDLEPKCSGIDQGFKIYLSTPVESLQISQKYFRIPLAHVNVIHIKPELTMTTEKLRNFKPHQRKCFYGDERQLRFFKSYTGVNCKTECMANFTKRECECVHFSMPSTYISCLNMSTI